MTWTQPQIERCRVLWKSGKYTSREIAVILSAAFDREVTHNAVICRMSRSGESFKGPTGNNVARSQSAGPRRRSDLSADELETVRSRERERDKRYKARVRERRGLPPVAQRSCPRSMCRCSRPGTASADLYAAIPACCPRSAAGMRLRPTVAGAPGIARSACSPPGRAPFSPSPGERHERPPQHVQPRHRAVASDSPEARPGFRDGTSSSGLSR